MKMGLLSGDEIGRLLLPLTRQEDLQLIILFGSLAKGTLHPRSDIDLAFLFDHPVDPLHLTNRVVQLLHTDRVDVVDLRRTTPLLAFSAAKNGRVLYERSPGIFNIFYSHAFRRFIDTAKLREAQAQAIRSFRERSRP